MTECAFISASSGPQQRRSGWFAGVALTLAVLSANASAVADDASAVRIGDFDNPVHIAVAPGQPQLLFVVEQPGRIQVLRNERPLARPFLDISRIVQFSGESGLLSVAFAPDYETSGLFYVMFNNRAGDVEINEFKRQEGSA